VGFGGAVRRAVILVSVLYSIAKEASCFVA
jgi:hypothetical protein